MSHFYADEPIAAASIYRVLLLAAVARSFDRGELDPSARVIIRTIDCTPVPTWLQHIPRFGHG
ncbi:serine hydrolase [Mycobacterium lepromatosis]|uniref:serine hydrolase n=1 Tax=Mycobacterium lepromatosis TaxID=480418 RepID=UPI000A80D38B